MVDIVPNRFILGELQKNLLNPHRLAHVIDLYPEIIEGPEDDQPSCSLVEALEYQELYVNTILTSWALQFQYEMFRKGFLKHQGAFINMAHQAISSIPVTHMPNQPRGIVVKRLK